ncbi:RNA polymerase factor sigma-54 [Sediminibacterium sp.]|uniref:RNA polymerase factor sigma-54 n=1 Tax=Sediminibacterium sp. TaxID=1917865 RepID=UPI0027354D6E|nr:RNA polymerase factor sigma-54 [Sediminibacterium sp.]MDP3567483.1 RNA polymerase factor sigma-54 [Sediminibacterium sp.]
MALKHSQQLKLSQKLLPQQILLMKLLQLPTLALEDRIKEELEANPALEEDLNDSPEEELYSNEEVDTTEEIEFDERGEAKEDESKIIENDVVMEDYMDAEELDSYKYEISNKGADDETREFVVVEGIGFQEQLEQQLGLKDITETEYTIGAYLIGCLDEDGYLRRELELIVDDLAFNYNITTTIPELEKALLLIQSFDPAGVGARNLQECLLIQLDRKAEKTKEVLLAKDIIKYQMEEFSKKHYDKILKRFHIESDELKDIVDVITHLNPRPGNSESKESNFTAVIPDFIITVNDGIPELSINGRNLPDLKISRDYFEMLKEYSKNKDKSAKEATGFIKSKIESAEWFIEALQQRHATLALCMHSILDYQHDYFVTGDESKLKPMILKDIASRVNLDLSTVSRVANSKYVQTPYGTFLLKTFFSESMSTDSGEEVSSREIKKILQDCILAEDKQHPYTDDALCNILKEKGYNIARRTVAKYREQLEIPVGRMRKEL